MKHKRSPATWIRIVQGLGLFIALIIVLPWLGGKLVPGRGTATPPAAQTPPAAATPHALPSQPPAGTDTPPSAPTQPEALPRAHAFKLGLTPEEISQLPAWQQDVLRDPGWQIAQPAPPTTASTAPGALQVKVSAVLPRLPGGREYQAQAAHMNDSLGCLVRLRLQPSGGKPDVQGRYKYCHWVFGDGSLGLDQTAFTDDTLELSHFFTGAGPGPARYVVRVQVVDAAGDTAFADSLPIVVQ